MTLLLHCTKAHVSLTRYRVVESELTSQIWCKEFWEVFKSNVQWTVRILSVSETAVLHVLSDLLEAVDSGDVAALVLPDLSAAFDTVNHFVPSAGMSFGLHVRGPALAWFQSYLSVRSQYVRRGILRSSSIQLVCGVAPSWALSCASCTLSTSLR